MFAKFSVKKPYTVLVAVVLIIVLGVVSFTRMTTDLLPNMSLPYVIVVTMDMGASPEEVEKDVTAPIEAAMATTSNIKSVSSSSSDSVSTVILEYEQSTNMDSIIIEIQQSLDQLQGSLPDTATAPIIMQIDPDMLPIMVASVDVEGMDISELSMYVEDELIPALESIEGVASVSATGVLDEDIQVTMDQAKIDALNEQILAKIDEQFEEAQKELDDGAAKIEEGKEALADGAEEFANQISEGYKEVINNKLTLNDTAKELRSALQELTEMQSLLKENSDSIEAVLDILQGTYDRAVKQEKLIATLQPIYDNYELRLETEALAQYQVSYETLSETEKEAVEQAVLAQINTETGKNFNSKNDIATAISFAKSEIDTLNTLAVSISGTFQQFGITLNSYKDIPAAIKAVGEASIQVNAGIAQIQSAQEQIVDGRTALDDALVTLNKTQIQTILQMSQGYTELAIASSQLAMGQAQMDSAKTEAENAANLNKILSIDTLSALLMAQNFAMPAGYITEGDEQYLIRVGDEISSMEELKTTVLIDLGMEGIEPITLEDVATVEMIDNSGESYAKVNGNPAIMLSIEKQTGYSTGNVTDTVLERFELLESQDEKLRLGVMMDQGIFIDMIVSSVLENMIVGAILAVIVLIIFLKDFRPTIVITCSIPLSVIFAIVLMYFSDISLNIISLSGLALGIGMLVDNSIVVIENIYRYRSEGYSVRKAAVEGASEVTGAIIGSTLTTVCVFAPIIFTEGVTRQLFVDIALTITFTLTASLIVAMTFVPMMASITLKKTKEVEHKFLDKVIEAYGRLLEKTLKWKPLVFILSIALLVGSMAASLSKGFTFLDMSMETDQLTVTVSAKKDEILKFDELTELSDEVVERLLTIEGIDSIGAMAGGASLMGGSSESVSMYITMAEDAEVSNAEVTKQIEELTADMDCLVKVDNSSSDMTAMLGSGISIQISGRKLETLQEIAKEVAKVAASVEGVVNVEDGLDNTTASFTISVDKDKAAQYGMTVAQVFQLVYAEMATATTATTISTDLQDYEVYVQGEEQSDVTLADIRGLKFTYTDRITGDEEEISLSTIATFKEGLSMNTISRSGQSRYISVSAGIDADHNVTLVSNAIMDKIQHLDIPVGYEIKMTGEDEMIMESMEQLVLMLLLAVIFIYLIMVAQFQSLLSPFIIMFTIPLAFTGGFAALYFAGLEVSVISMIGFVMLAGIIVNNGIVLVDYMNQLRREGMSKKEAIVEAGKTRLRPVLMTALTTILAMSTMAMGLGEGSEMMKPMAIVEVGGLVYGTLLTLFVVPCLYDAFNREKSMVEEEL